MTNEKVAKFAFQPNETRTPGLENNKNHVVVDRRNTPKITPVFLSRRSSYSGNGKRQSRREQTRGLELEEYLLESHPEN